MYRVLLPLVALLGLAAPVYSQGDPLAIFDGIWVSVNPPGPHIIFNKVGLGRRAASLPAIGQSIMTVSDGKDGSNLKVSGPGFDCYYFFGKINPVEMIWDLKSGDPVCPKSAYFKKDPP